MSTVDPLVRPVRMRRPLRLWAAAKPRWGACPLATKGVCKLPEEATDWREPYLDAIADQWAWLKVGASDHTTQRDRGRPVASSPGATRDTRYSSTCTTEWGNHLEIRRSKNVAKVGQQSAAKQDLRNAPPGAALDEGVTKQVSKRGAHPCVREAMTFVANSLVAKSPKVRAPSPLFHWTDIGGAPCHLERWPINEPHGLGHEINRRHAHCRPIGNKLALAMRA